MQGDLAKSILEKYGGNLERLNVHTHMGCNLTCSGCSHHSEFVDVSESVDIEQLIKDLEILLEKTEIRTFHILGGEPLLNPKGTKAVCEYLISKGKKVKLLTNGFYVNKHDDWLLDLVERGMTLKISVHVGPGDKSRDNLAEKVLDFYKKAIAKNIKFMRRNTLYEDQDFGWIEISNEWQRKKEIWGHIIKYEGDKVYPFNSDKDKAFKICETNCPQLYKGKLYKCSHTAYLSDMLAIKEQLDDPEWAPYLKYDGVDINDNSAVEEFLQTVYTAEDVCSSCPETKQYITMNQDISIKKKVIPIKHL